MQVIIFKNRFHFQLIKNIQPMKKIMPQLVKNILSLSLLATTLCAEGVGLDQALFSSGTLTKSSPKKSVDINIDIRNKKELYLVVGDNGDGYGHDHVDWVDLKFIGPKGELKLTDLTWKSATQDSGTAKLHKSYDSNTLSLDKKSYSEGIGTHSSSMIVYDIPEGYERFQAIAGIDDEVLGKDNHSRPSVELFVFAEKPDLNAVNRTRSETHIPLSLFTLPEGLEITLWATSPLLFNPTNMDVDAKGRIWVAEGMNYRGSKLRPEGDRIVVIEDSDGDGQADKSHTFVQDPELISPLGIAVVGQRVIVSQPPHLLVYHDLNNDALFDPKVDRKEILLDGFGGQNHDHSLHSATVGPNGQLYFNTGNAGNFETKDRNGRTFRAASGYNGGIDQAGLASADGHVYIGGTAMRINLDGTDLNVIGHNFRNSYEQTITSFGDVFQNDNDDPPAARTTWLMEYGNLGFYSTDGKRSWGSEKRPGQTTQIAEWRQEDPDTIPAGDVYGGGAPTGITYYENGPLASRYHGLLLSCEPTRNTVFGYLPKPDGAGFKLERFDLLTTNSSGDYAGADFIISNGKMGHDLKTLFRPSDIVVGPDGAIYISDWFDARVGGHGTLDKKGFGSIYRITVKGDRSQAPKIDFNSIQGQLLALKSPAVNVRGHAFHLLTTGGEASFKALQTMLNDSNPDFQARAIWALAAHSDAGRKAIETYLQHNDPQFRIVTYRALRHFSSDILPVATLMAKDNSLAVRREVALSLRNLPIQNAMPILQQLSLALDANDPWSIAAFGMACAGKESAVYQALRSQWPENASTWSPLQAKLAWRLHPEAAIKDLTALAMAKNLPEPQRRKAVVALGFITSESSSDAMVNIAKYADAEVQKEASWWVHHRENNLWRAFHPVKKLTGKDERSELADYLIPYNMSPKVELPPVDAVAKLNGDANRGQTSVARCTMCHRLDGQGVDFGPDLSIFGKNNSTKILINAIINPSAELAHGYKGEEIKTNNGKTIQGLIIADGDPIIVKVFGGAQIVIDKTNIASRHAMKESLMIPASNLGLSAQDVADIVAFLKK